MKLSAFIFIFIAAYSFNPTIAAADVMFKCKLPTGGTVHRKTGCLEGEETMFLVDPKKPDKKIPVESKSAGDGVARTNPDNLACRSEEWFEDAIAFVVAADRGSLDAYVRTGKCIVLKGGVRVTVLDRSGLFGSRVKFAYQGIKFWAEGEAIDYGL